VSAGWLRLREPFDHAARSLRLARDLARFLREKPRPVRLLELGCGLASGLRFLAPHLPAPQAWTLVDIDPTLLDALPDTLVAWAETFDERLERTGDATLESEKRTIRWRVHDVQDLDRLVEPADAVVTQALLDLVSHDWLDELAGWLAARAVPLLAALTVDGRVTWTPEDPRDRSVQAAFRAHQLTDRGFGSSPGPKAADDLAALLRARGFAIQLARADWRISPEHTAMLAEMVHGTAEAAAEMHPHPPTVAAWRADRLAAAEAGDLALTVGHLDLLAWPREAAG
jgi:hypothetical protein